MAPLASAADGVEFPAVVLSTKTSGEAMYFLAGSAGGAGGAIELLMVGFVFLCVYAIHRATAKKS